jgi:hypothetical protein
VRFWLSPPPEETIEESMATRQNPRRSVRDKQAILPTAPKDEEWKLGPANTWGKEHLRLLGVNFTHRQRRFDVNRILHGSGSAWPPEVQMRIIL